jgi:hypothetical protein
VLTRGTVVSTPGGWGNTARKAVAAAGYWLVLGLITFVGINAVIEIKETRTRLVLVVVVIAVAFGVASLVERLLRRGEPAEEGWPRWYSQLSYPMVYRRPDRVPYSYVVLPQPN